MFFSRCLELEAVLGNGNCWHRFDCLHFTEQSTKPKPALVEGGGRVQNTKKNRNKHKEDKYKDIYIKPKPSLRKGGRRVWKGYFVEPNVYAKP